MQEASEHFFFLGEKPLNFGRWYMYRMNNFLNFSSQDMANKKPHMD